jgi:hypothetical protein
MRLSNLGGIAGCKCYSTAASVNEMFSLTYPDGKLFRELFLDHPKYKLFNSLHCDPTLFYNRPGKRPSTPVHKPTLMYFIDKRTTVNIFKLVRKLKKLRRKGIPITVDDININDVISDDNDDSLKRPSAKRRHTTNE